MRYFMSLGAVTLSVSLLSSWSADALGASPVVTVRRTSFAAPLASERVLYREGDATVLRAADAREEDFANLYVVNLSNRFDLPVEIESVGTVIGFESGRFAVMRLTPAEAEDVAGKLHGAGHACGVLTRLDGRPLVTEAVATPTPLIPVTLRDARVERVVQRVLADNIKATVEELAEMFSRYHGSATGGDVPDLLAQKYEALRMGRADVTIARYDHGSETPQDSLVVRIEGATRPSEVIILGSHLDSVNWQGGTSSRSPGADDNASGTATNLEIFRLMMEEGIRPERTIEIHAYAAEEIGLVGSQDIANDYRDRGVNVVAMVQHDMTMWKAAGTEDKIWFVTSNTDNGFNDLLTQLASGYAGMTTAKAALSGGSSDHASWRRAGFATAFPFENPSAYNRHIHTANDTTANANAFNQAAGFAKLGLAYAMHFGGLN